MKDSLEEGDPTHLEISMKTDNVHCLWEAPLSSLTVEINKTLCSAARIPELGLKTRITVAIPPSWDSDFSHSEKAATRLTTGSQLAPLLDIAIQNSPETFLWQYTAKAQADVRCRWQIQAQKQPGM